jgi:outer membrane protein
MLLCLVGTATAQDTTHLGTVNDVISAVIKTNPTQAIYQQQVKQAGYNHKAANGAFYPGISGSFSGQDNLHLAVTPVPGELIGQPGTTFYAQFGKKYAYNTGITVNENVFDWTLVLQSAIAKNNITLTELQQAYFTQSLKEQAARLYFSLQISQASRNIANNDLAMADSLVTLARQRLNEGTSDALALNQAQINYNNVLQNEAQSQQLYDQGVENLKILLGVKPLTELALPQGQEPDLGTITPGIDKNLEVYRQQFVLAGLQSKAQKAVAYPKLSINGYFGAQQFRNDFGLGFGSGDWSGYRYVGLNLNVPIFTGLANSYRYKSSQVQAQIAEQQYNTAVEQSQINDRLLLKNEMTYTAWVKAAESSFHLYATNVRLNRQKYQEGIINMDTYLKAFEDYLRAENTYLSNLSQLLSVKATILSRL